MPRKRGQNPRSDQGGVVWKFLCVKLTPEDDAKLQQGLADAKRLGFATIRTRSAFVRHAMYEAAERNAEAVKRVGGVKK